MIYFRINYLWTFSAEVIKQPLFNYIVNEKIVLFKKKKLMLGPICPFSDGGLD
jgi:hypothetical protein